MKTPNRPRKRQGQGVNSFAPYIFHFTLFVVVFFLIVGGALFVLNFASAQG